MNNIINRVRQWRPSKLVTAALIGAVAVAGGGTAYAAGVTVLPPNVVGSAQIVAGGVWGGDIHDNTIPESKLGWDLRQKINKPAAGTPGTPGKSYGCDGAVVDATHPAAKCPGAQGEPGAASTVAGPAGPTGPAGPAASDVNGTSTLKAVYNDKMIENTGGSWLTRRTHLGTITVPAGKWNISTSVQFQRTAAQAAGDLPTRPQLALRVGASATSFGATVGTVGGNDISPVVEGDLFGSDSRLVTFAEETTVEVSAFGYEDDRGSSDSSKIKVVNATVFVTAG